MNEKLQRFGGLILVLTGLVLAAFYCALKFEVTTEITHFLPEGTDRHLGQISRAMADSELTRTVVLTVGGPDSETAVTATRALSARLRRSPQVAWIRSGDSPGLQEAFYEMYFSRRLMFLSDQPEQELPQRLSNQGLTAAARELKRQLTLPTGPLIRQIAAQDPLLAFPAWLERLKLASTETLEIKGGQLVTTEGRGVILLGSRGGAFDTTAQGVLQAELEAAFAAVDREHQGSLDLNQTSAGRFAIAAEAMIKDDITRISVVSTVAIIVFFLLLFRSIRALGLVFLPVISGMVGALAVGLLLFGRLHGITLAFGATLIGVGIDYAIHLQSHQLLAPHPAGPAATLRHVWPALLLGALTTVGGLGGMALAGLPGIKEMALFASTGVLLALIATRLCLPPLLPRRAEAPLLLRRLSQALGQLLAVMAQRRTLLLGVPLAAIVLCAFGLPSLRWDDDLTALQPLDPDLLEEDRRVRGQVSHVESGRLVVALGDTLEEALQQNDLVYQRLVRAQRDGLIGDFRSLHQFLWSVELQSRNLAVLQATTALSARFRAALAREGFRSESFQPFLDETLGGPAPAPLRLEDLQASPLADLVRPFRVEVGERVALLTFLRDVRDAPALSARLAGLNGVVYFDQFTYLSGVYRVCRTRTLQLLVAGLLAIGAMLLFRYRRVGLALAAFAPAVLAAGATLGLLACAGVSVNMFHLLGLLLVLSMGEDYGIFMVESRESPEELTASAVGVLGSCLSTVCAFGLLALSHNPAMRALGFTTGVGVFLSFLFAPTALVILGPRHSPAFEPGEKQS